MTDDIEWGCGIVPSICDDDERYDIEHGLDQVVYVWEHANVFRPPTQAIAQSLGNYL